VKRICRYLPLLALPLIGLSLANAQSGVDIGVGFGAAQDSAAKTGLDPNTLNACPLGSNPTGAGCTATPSLSTFMIGFSGDLMLWKHFGVGAEVNFQPSKQDYVNLNASAASQGLNTFAIQSRTTFYDFNGIYQPVKTKKASLKLEGGIGGANIKFYQSGSSSNSLIGSQNFSQYFGSSNHFQVHGGAGVQIYLTEHLFIRPQFDVHYVHNLNQFGRATVTEETVWIGYTLGQ
jgi:Outer membrane protein beta-barrel domain